MPGQPPARRPIVGHALTAEDLATDNQEATEADALDDDTDQKWGRGDAMHLTEADTKGESNNGDASNNRQRGS